MLRPHFPTPLAALVLVITAWLLTSVIGYGVQVDPSKTQQTIDPGYLSISYALVFGVIATLAARRVPAPQPERLGLTPLPLRHLPLVVMAVPFAIVASELDNWLTIPFPGADAETLSQQLEQMRTLTPLALTQIAIFRIGIEPVVTEFLFRGVIQQGMIAYLGRFTGVLLTAALSLDLAGAIATSGSPVSALVVSLLFGLALGYLRIGTGSLLATILVRAAWNTMGLFGVVYAKEFPVPGFNTFGDHTHPILLAASSACVVWASIELLRALRAHPVVLPIEEEPEPEEDDGGTGFF
jgi:membrane protease YdiL (CAAX protease family)